MLGFLPLDGFDWPSLLGILRLSVLRQVALRYVEDLATVWCEWCEMELRHKNFKSALELMRRATYTPDKINRKEVRPRSKLALTMYRSWAGQSDEQFPSGGCQLCASQGWSGQLHCRCLMFRLWVSAYSTQITVVPEGCGCA